MKPKKITDHFRFMYKNMWIFFIYKIFDKKQSVAKFLNVLEFHQKSKHRIILKKLMYKLTLSFKNLAKKHFVISFFLLFICLENLDNITKRKSCSVELRMDDFGL